MTKRQPHPTGRSDTDWIKKLQDEEENPLGCLHINQGSFDAAADAYEEEYKMSKRTAMDIALDLDAAACSSFVKLEAAEALRQKHDEIERMRKELESARLYLGDSKLESDQLRDEAYSARKQRDSEKQKAKMLQAEIDRLKRERHHIYDPVSYTHLDVYKRQGARFIDSQHKQYERDAKPEDRRTVTEATRAEYQAGR